MSGESNNFGTIIKQLVNDIMMDFFLTYSPKPGKMIDFDFNKDSTSLIINLSDFLPWVAREKTEKHVERHDTETIEFGDF